jgi:uncharacterized membrane protein
MIGRLFWAAGVLVLAVIIHLSYVLFGPRFAMHGFEAEAASYAGGVNRMQVLDAAQYADLFGAASTQAVAAVCAFDLSDGDVTLHAAFSGSPWTLRIYAARGNAIYALNDAQAGTDDVTVRIRQVTGLKRLLGGDEEAGVVNDGWRVETAEKRGLAVLWSPIAEPALRRRSEEALKQSYCRPAS